MTDQPDSADQAKNPKQSNSARQALDSLGEGKDILEYLTSVTQHSDSVEATNGRELILNQALDCILIAEKHIKEIYRGGEA